MSWYSVRVVDGIVYITSLDYVWLNDLKTELIDFLKLGTFSVYAKLRKRRYRNRFDFYNSLFTFFDWQNLFYPSRDVFDKVKCMLAELNAEIRRSIRIIDVRQT